MNRESFVGRLAASSQDGRHRLIWSVLLFIGATWLFGGVAEDVVSGDPLVAVDQIVTQWFQYHAHAGVTRLLQRITDAHGALPVSAVGVACAIYLGWRGQRDWIVTLLWVLPGGMLMNLLLKQVFHRQRPLLDDPLLVLAGYSFPSGHVTAATLLYGVVAAYLATRTHETGRRLALWAVALLLVVLVALTRVYLGAHFFSDVVAAAAWGTAWLVLCLVVMDERQRRRGSFGPRAPRRRTPGGS